MGYSVYSIDKKRKASLIDTGVVTTEDNRAKVIPRITHKQRTDITGKKKMVKVKSKRKGNATESHHEAASTLSKAIVKLVKQHNIVLGMAELPTGSENAKSALLLGYAGGIAISAFIALDIELIRISPNEVKHKATELLKEKLGITMPEKEEPNKKQIMELALHMYPTSAENATKVFKSGAEKIMEGVYEHIADSVIIFEHGYATEAFQKFLDTSDIKLYQQGAKK